MKYLSFILCFVFGASFLFAQNNVNPIKASDVDSILTHQDRDYKLIMFWVPKCESIETQYQDVSSLKNALTSQLTILPVAVVSTRHYENDFHNLFYKENNLGNSLEVQKIMDNPYENFEAFKKDFLAKYSGKSIDSFYFLFNSENKLIKEWENLPTKEELQNIFK